MTPTATPSSVSTASPCAAAVVEFSNGTTIPSLSSLSPALKSDTPQPRLGGEHDDTTYGAWWAGQIAAQRVDVDAASRRVTTDDFCRRANVTLRPVTNEDRPPSGE